MSSSSKLSRRGLCVGLADDSGFRCRRAPAPGDFEVSLEELRRSVLVAGDARRQANWDTAWRAQLVENLEVLTRQLWSVGVRGVYADGSFAEDKDHPNDIHGYFVCNLQPLITGELTRQLNLLDPSKVWTWDPI